MLDILYRDDHLVAINKPSGLLVHRSDIDRHETRFAVQLLRDQIGHRVFPLHRLDKPTSGVLLFALDADTAREVGGQFERNEIGKRYLAVVRGWPPEQGVIDHPLSRRFDDYGRKYTPGNEPEPLPALTCFRRLATIELPEAVERYPSTRYALVELEPRSGRQHQLRRHMKHIAHPIIGDATHGKGPLNRAVADWLGTQRLWLHASRLTMQHPITGAALDLEARRSPDWDRWPRA